MTRKEQINLYLKERNISVTSLEANSIIEGIEWADEHPNLKSKELLYTIQKTDKKTKKKIISKACEWISIYYPNIDRMGIDNFIAVFRKAMEE